jgi:hypothetical protein
MRHNQAISSERFRRMLGLAAFTLLLVAALLSAGCTGGTSDGGGTSGGGGTTVPPRSGGALGDTPIVISGGSTEIDMYPDTFKPVSGNTNKFSSVDAGKFLSVIVYDDSENAKDEDFITFAIPTSGKCSVILKHKDGTITMSNESTDKIEVDFDTTKIKPRPHTPSGKTLQYFNRKMKLEGVEVKTGGSAVVCQDYQGKNTPCKLPPGGKFTVEVWFQ